MLQNKSQWWLSESYKTGFRCSVYSQCVSINQESTLWTTSSSCVNQSLKIQTTQSQHLNFCTFRLLLPTTCFGHSFDHHQVEEMQVQRGNMLLKASPLHKSSGVVITWAGFLGIHKYIVFTQVKNRRCIKPNFVAEKKLILRQRSGYLKFP